MKRIRVLLYGQPGVGLDPVRRLFGTEPDFDLVGEAERPLELLLAVKDTAADVVVLSEADDCAESVTSHLLAEYPGLTVLALSALGASVTRLCLQREVLADREPPRVLGFLRRAVEGAAED